MSAWNEECDKLTPKRPGTFEAGDTMFAFSADDFCPHCDVELSFGEIQWGDDHPPENNPTVAICWKCKKEFHAWWVSEPMWYVGKI